MRFLYGLLIFASGLILVVGMINTHIVSPRVSAALSQNINETGLLAFSSNRDGGLAIYVMNSNGTTVRRLTEANGNDSPAWSPDGKHIAFASIRDGHLQIYVMDPDGSNQINLSNNDESDAEPSWSPDGKHIAFSSSHNNGIPQIYIMNSDGSGRIKIIYSEHPRDGSSPSWSPDGKHIAFSSSHDGPDTLYLIDTDGKNLSILRQGNFHPTWSPDSRVIASDGFLPSGKQTIYLTDITDGKTVELLSSKVDGSWPTWSPDGKFIAFNSGTDAGDKSQIYVVKIDGTGLINVSNTDSFDAHPSWGPNINANDIKTASATMSPVSTSSTAVPESTYSSVMATLLVAPTHIIETATQQALLSKTPSAPTIEGRATLFAQASAMIADATRTAESRKSNP